MKDPYVMTWKGAFLLSLTSFIIAFPCFLVYEVIWGDMVKDILIPSFYLEAYTRIDIALFLGFLIVLAVCIVVNLILYRQYSFSSKLRANLYATLITILLLYAISFAFMFYLFPDTSIFLILIMFPYYLVYFSVYVLQTPILFWFLAMIIYHVSLVVLYKLILVKKIPIYKIKNSDGVYQSRVI